MRANLSISTVLLLLCTAGCASPRVDLRPSNLTAAHAPQLSIMTANLHRNTRGADVRLLARNIQSDLDRPPDFIVCQEVMFSPLGPGRSAAGIFADALDYHWRGNPRGVGSFEGSAILSRYPFTFYDTRVLDSSPSRWLLGFRRMSVMGEFAVPGVGLVRVVNVHLQDGPTKAHNRRAQLAETLRWVADRETEQPADVIFIAGDFNAPPEAPELSVLWDGSTLASFWNFNTHRLTKFDDAMTACILRLDNVYVQTASPGLLTFQSERILWSNGLLDRNGVKRFISDHLPLMHVYELPLPPRPAVAGGTAARQ